MQETPHPTGRNFGLEVGRVVGEGRGFGAAIDLDDHRAPAAAEQKRGRPFDAPRLASLITAVGYHRVVLSSDAGQPGNPTPPQALHLLIDALAAQGLDRKALLACASEIPERLVTP